MQSSKFIATILVGVLLILGACASPAATPPPTQSRAAPVATTPAPTAPASAAAPAVAPAQTPSPAPAPAAVQKPGGEVLFTYSDLQVTPAKARPGETVNVVVKARNISGQSGTSSVVMQIAGDDEACPMISPQTKNVTLGAGEIKEVAFEFPTSKDLGGAYTVVIGGEKARLIVE